MVARPLRTFLSYAHADQKFRADLRKHIALLERERVIELWDDHELKVGQELDSSILQQLEQADVFILLVSPDFIASEYCYGIEMKHALERHARGDALVLPIIVRACQWQHSPLGKLVVAPADGKPIDSWDRRDEGWNDAARQLRAAILAFRRKTRSAPTPSPSEPNAGKSRAGALAMASAAAAVVLLAGGLAFWQTSRRAQPEPTVTPRPEIPDASAPPRPALPPAPVAEDAGAKKTVVHIPPPPPADNLVELKVKVVVLPVNPPPPATSVAMIRLLQNEKEQARHEGELTARVSPGDYMVEVSSAGGPPFFKREPIEVGADLRTKDVTVTVSHGLVTVTAYPEPDIFIDGFRTESRPARVELYEGKHVVRLECPATAPECPGGSVYSTEIELKAGQHEDVKRTWP